MTLETLIEFYEAIPAENWCQQRRANGPQRCAFQHLCDAIDDSQRWEDRWGGVSMPRGASITELVNVNDAAPSKNIKGYVLDYLRRLR